MKTAVILLFVSSWFPLMCSFVHLLPDRVCLRSWHQRPLTCDLFMFWLNISWRAGSWKRRWSSETGRPSSPTSWGSVKSARGEGKKGWREIRKKQKLQSDLWCEMLQGHLLKMKLGQECKACSLWFNRLVHSFLQVLKICYLTQQILERLGGPHISGRGVLWHLWYNQLPCPAQLPRLHWLRTQPDLPGKDVHWAHVSNKSFTWIRFKLSENFRSNYEKRL